jgi:NAD(P)H-hydrate epimerase
MLDPVYTAAEMRAAEERHPGYPGTASELMERAGTAVAREVVQAYPTARRIAVVCGKGANGGDGRVAARLLREAGREAVETDDPAGYDVVIDALFGTGFHGAPRAEAAALIGRINSTVVPVVSVDVPSGVDASTGEIEGEAVRADLTVTFHGLKVGLLVAPGRFQAGRIVEVDIGLEHARSATRHATSGLLAQVPLRAVRDSKYTAGHVVVIGGAEGMTGAAVLTAMAALRADAGYVTLCVPRASLAVAEALALEPVKHGFDWQRATDTLLPSARRAHAVALGPGLGRSETARLLVHELLEAIESPVVVDADALFALEPGRWSQPRVLTPHEGELARLLDAESSWVRAHRLAAARTAAERFRSTVVLKGADTLVVSTDGSAIVCDTGPPSLATAGTGDVLSGVIAAFLAKGLAPETAAAAAAVAHGLAAAAAPHQAGLVASDVVAALPAVLS